MAGQAASQVGAQQGAVNALAGQTNTLAGQQIGATTAQTQANLQNTQQQQQALGALNNANVASQGNVNSANANLASTTMQGQQGLLGGALNGAGSAIGSLAHGGVVRKKMADGGAPQMTTPTGAAASQPSSAFGNFLQGWGKSMNNQDGQKADYGVMNGVGNSALNKGMTSLGKGVASYLNKPGSVETGDTSSVAGPDQSDTSDIAATQLCAIPNHPVINKIITR